MDNTSKNDFIRTINSLKEKEEIEISILESGFEIEIEEIEGYIKFSELEKEIRVIKDMEYMIRKKHIMKLEKLKKTENLELLKDEQIKHEEEINNIVKQRMEKESEEGKQSKKRLIETCKRIEKKVEANDKRRESSMYQKIVEIIKSKTKSK